MLGGSGPRGLDPPGGGLDPAGAALDPAGTSDGGRRVDAPIELLWSEQDPWCPPALADAYAAVLPGARIERIAGAGHWPWLDRPELVERVSEVVLSG